MNHFRRAHRFGANLFHDLLQSAIVFVLVVPNVGGWAVDAAAFRSASVMVNSSLLADLGDGVVPSFAGADSELDKFVVDWLLAHAGRVALREYPIMAKLAMSVR